MRPTRLLALPLLAALASCHGITSQEVTLLDAPPLPYSIADDKIAVTEGTAVVVRIALLDEDDYLVVPTTVTWTVEGTAAAIAPTDVPDIYAISGLAAGNATLVGTSQDAGDEARIVVTVTPQ